MYYLFGGTVAVLITFYFSYTDLLLVENHSKMRFFSFCVYFTTNVILSRLLQLTPAH